MKKQFIALLLCATISLGVVGCGGNSNEKAPETDGGQASSTDSSNDSQVSDDAGEAAQSTSSEGSIKIGGLAPLTGNVAQYGITTTNGANLFFKELNEKGGILGKQVEYLVEDEEGDPQKAILAYKKLVENDKVVAVLGDVTSGPSTAAASASQEYNTPMIAATATAAEVTKQGPNVFRACFLDPFQGTTMATFASTKLNAKTAGVIFNNGDDYSIGLKDAFISTCQELGIEIVATESFGNDDVDYRSQLGNIAAKNPDVLFVPDYYGKVVNIIAQARELNLNVPCLGADGWDGVLQSTPDAATLENCYFSNHYSTEDTDPVVQNFLKNYEATYGEAPTSFAALGYDAAMILTNAIEKAGTADDAQKIIDAMLATDVTGVTGHITFDEERNPKKSCAIILIKEGKYTLFDKL